MTLEQHREFGKQVKKFRETLMQHHVMNVETKASREQRATSNALKHLENMRSAMDSLVCRDFPNCDDAVEIYYGPYTARAEMGAASPNEL